MKPLKFFSLLFAFVLLISACNSATPVIPATVTSVPEPAATPSHTPQLATPTWTATATQPIFAAPTLTATPRLFTPRPTATVTVPTEPLPGWFGQSRIAFTTSVSFAAKDSPTSGLALLGADGTNMTPLMISETEFFSRPQWSPDGHWLGYLKRDRLNMEELYITHMDGTRSLRLTYTDGVYDFAWSPDGEYLVVVIHQLKDSAANLHLVTNLYIITRQGGYIRQLTAGSTQNFAPIWSADGSLIYFLRDEVEGTSSLLDFRQIWLSER